MTNTELSIEFFPPQTSEGATKLRAEREKLAVLEPDFFSVTYGAGGSTRERSFAIVKEIAAEGFEATPHLSCIGSTRAGIREMLASFKVAGIRRIVALRGDLPSGMAAPGELRYANELVEFIRAETGDSFQIIVAAYPEWHPQAITPAADLQNFARKVKAGANTAITQYFYNVDAYFHFVEKVRTLGVEIPIIPGIMPIASFSKLARFSDACGADIPRWMRRTFESYGDDTASIRAFGVEIVTRLCERLLRGGAPGLHFYSMNSAALTTEIWQQATGNGNQEAGSGKPWVKRPHISRPGSRSPYLV
ncbi:MAG: methylenetetrahydrofolate reductase [NAD(P)H] [Azoarcus sp.]|jgi:methylenetetrahydrofolate reductase (NADPH)|nr:methylenetetrahydrofolate reductase [NAD(P)H] [Azoarcus sp.]